MKSSEPSAAPLFVWSAAGTGRKRSTPHSQFRKPPVESEFPSNRRWFRRVEISAAHFLSAVTSEDCHLRATLLVQVMIPHTSP